MPGLRPAEDKENMAAKKENHIKKPLNAFMLYMREMRPIVQAECALKESAAINQILGRRVSRKYLKLKNIISKKKEIVEK